MFTRHHAAAEGLDSSSKLIAAVALTMYPLAASNSSDREGTPRVYG